MNLIKSQTLRDKEISLVKEIIENCSTLEDVNNAKLALAQLKENQPQETEVLQEMQEVLEEYERDLSIGLNINILV